VSGADSGNVCPASSVRIETEAACRTAVSAVGKTAGSGFANSFVQAFATWPRGCSYSGINAYFNTDPVGAGRFSYKLLCAAFATSTHALRTLSHVHATLVCPSLVEVLDCAVLVPVGSDAASCRTCGHAVGTAGYSKYG
jgi:hypothetical protein